MTEEEEAGRDIDVSWDHYLPQDEWDAVVADAEQIYAERAEEEGLGGGAEFMPLGLTPRRMAFPDTYGKNSGRIVRNQLWVNHTAECPLRVGFAESLTKWGNGGYQPRASWQMFVDPATVVTWISFGLAAFLHGPANSLGWGWEQAGYARFSRAEWLTPDGLRQLDLLAQEIVRRGIPKDAVRWLTNTQVALIRDRKDTTTRGLCDHRQISPGTRSDGGNGYPRDVLLDFIKAYHPDFPDRTVPGTPGTVRIGDRGPQVTEIQKLLVAAGYDAGVVDGVAGILFDTAVRAFQKDNGLDVDGVVGPLTLTKLKESDMTPEQAAQLTTIFNRTDYIANKVGIGKLDARTDYLTNKAVPELLAKVEALAETVALLASNGAGGGLTAEQVTQAAEAGAAAALEGYELTLAKPDTE